MPLKPRQFLKAQERNYNYRPSNQYNYYTGLEVCKQDRENIARVERGNMCLPTSEAGRFYKIWKSLLLYANQQYHLVPAWKDATLDTALNTEDVLPVRDRIWKDDSLIDRFIAQNPDHLSEADLAMVDLWKKYRHQGDFIVLKTLKKHAIFISEDKSGKIYAVKGLYTPFEEMLPFIPIMVKTVLLPFEQEIISDGLLLSYAISFGGGITRSLQEAYADAKERGEIITSLMPSLEPTLPQEQLGKAEATNKKVLADFEKHLLRKGSSLKIIERDMATVKQFAQEKLSGAKEPQSLRDVAGKDYLAFLKEFPASGRHSATISLKRFIQFMRESGRMDWGEAEEILVAIKAF